MKLSSLILAILICVATAQSDTLTLRRADGGTYEMEGDVKQYKDKKFILVLTSGGKMNLSLEQVKTIVFSEPSSKIVGSQDTVTLQKSDGSTSASKGKIKCFEDNSFVVITSQGEATFSVDQVQGVEFASVEKKMPHQAREPGPTQGLRGRSRRRGRVREEKQHTAKELKIKEIAKQNNIEVEEIITYSAEDDGKDNIKLEGTALDPDALSDLIMHLKGLPWVDNATLTDLSPLVTLHRGAYRWQEVDFRLQTNLHCWKDSTEELLDQFRKNWIGTKRELRKTKWAQMDAMESIETFVKHLKDTGVIREAKFVRDCGQHAPSLFDFQAKGGYCIKRAMEYDMEYFSQSGFLARRRIVVTYHGITSGHKSVMLSHYDSELSGIYNQIRRNAVTFPIEEEIVQQESKKKEFDDSKLRNKTGTLIIAPYGFVYAAKAYVDGEEKGEVGLSGLDIENLLEGEHQLRVVKTGYKVFEKKFRIIAGKTTLVNMDLKTGHFSTCND